jgi:sulfate transport system ATP-binding protein
MAMIPCRAAAALLGTHNTSTARNRGRGRLNTETAPSDSSRTTPIFGRPHLLDIQREPGGEHSFKARVTHINPAGPVVKVELLSEWDQHVQVNLTQERYRELHLEKDANVYVIPRELKAFIES